MANPYYQGPVSDHFDGERFFNPGVPTTDKSLGDLWRWRREGQRMPWPEQVPVTPVVPEARVTDGLRVTVVGHMTVLIQVAGLNILTDPVWADRAGPKGKLGPRRVTAPGVAFDSLPPIDAVLVSHNHYDHLDSLTLARLQAAHDPLVVTPLGNDTLLRKAAKAMRTRTGDWGDAVALGAGVEAHIVPAYHWSARGLRDKRMALWGGFMLKTPAGGIYFAGDTGYQNGQIFRDIAAAHGAPALALVPIGAYDPRWFMAAQHVNPEEAMQMVLDLGAPRALGLHWGTFQLTDEAREEPAQRFLAAAARAGYAAGTCIPAEAGQVHAYGGVMGAAADSPSLAAV